MYSFRIADDSAADAIAWYELRTSVYLEAGWITTNQCGSDGVYRDPYDEYSVRILGLDVDGEPVASLRVIDGMQGPLQVTDLFGIAVDGERVCEVGGTAVKRHHRKSLVTLGLFRAAYELFHPRRGYSNCYQIVAEEYRRAVEAMGFPIVAITEPRAVYNSVDLVARMAVDQVSGSLHAADQVRGGRTSFGRYFDDPFTWTLKPADVLRPIPAGVTE